MFKIALNSHKPYNYAFFCPVSKLHLTVSNPVGFVHEVTPAISTGLKYGTLIDVDGTTSFSTEKAKKTEQKPTDVPQNPLETHSEDSLSVPTDNDTNKKKRNRKTTTPSNTQDVSGDLLENI